MKITSVKVKKINDSEKNRLIGVATAVIDDEFIVTDIKIIRGDNRLFLSMPSQKMADGKYKDIVHPLTSECRQRFETKILNEFNKLDLSKGPVCDTEKNDFQVNGTLYVEDENGQQKKVATID